jgi:hypothetical protein
MIDHIAVERLGGAREAPRGSPVGLNWPRVSARVIVGEHQPSAAMGGGIDDDLPQGEVGPTLIAREACNVEAARLIVDMGDPQILALWVSIGDAAGAEGFGGRKAVELERRFGTLEPH